LVGAIVLLVSVAALVLRARSGTLPWSATRVEETARRAASGTQRRSLPTSSPRTAHPSGARSAAVSAELQGRLVEAARRKGSRV
jgi:hypothetical protein